MIIQNSHSFLYTMVDTLEILEHDQKALMAYVDPLKCLIVKLYPFLLVKMDYFALLCST